MSGRQGIEKPQGWIKDEARRGTGDSVFCSLLGPDRLRMSYFYNRLEQTLQRRGSPTLSAVS